MPLVKLWNSLRGRSKEKTTTESAAPATEAAVEPTHSAKPAKSGGKRRLFGGGPHAALCRHLKGITPNSVLEISVGDGSRALAAMETLTKKRTDVDIRYVAIDQFELGDGELKLKEFHRLLRAHGIRPQLFPETIDSGLRRVASTLGAVDLILIAASTDAWQNPITRQLLSRLSHSETIVLFADGENWTRYNSTSTELRRAG